MGLLLSHKIHVNIEKECNSKARKRAFLETSHVANIHVISFLRYLIRQKHENKAVIYKIYNKTLNWLEASLLT